MPAADAADEAGEVCFVRDTPLTLPIQQLTAVVIDEQTAPLPPLPVTLILNVRGATPEHTRTYVQTYTYFSLSYVPYDPMHGTEFDKSGVARAARTLTTSWVGLLQRARCARLKRRRAHPKLRALRR